MLIVLLACKFTVNELPFFYARTSTALRTYVLTPYARTSLPPMDVRLQIHGRTSIENDYKIVVIFDYYLSENINFLLNARTAHT